MFALRNIISGLVLCIFVATPNISLSKGPKGPRGPPVGDIDPPSLQIPGTVDTVKTVAKDKDGWELKEYQQKTETGETVISYEIVDPFTRKSYPAVRSGKTVTISDEMMKLLRKDRKKKIEEIKEAGDDTAVCFSADTKVLMGDGRSLEISKVKEGDLVRSTSLCRSYV